MQYLIFTFVHVHLRLDCWFRYRFSYPNGIVDDVIAVDYKIALNSKLIYSIWLAKLYSARLPRHSHTLFLYFVGLSRSLPISSASCSSRSSSLAHLSLGIQPDAADPLQISFSANSRYTYVSSSTIPSAERNSNWKIYGWRSMPDMCKEIMHMNHEFICVRWNSNKFPSVA